MRSIRGDCASGPPLARVVAFAVIATVTVSCTATPDSEPRPSVAPTVEAAASATPVPTSESLANASFAKPRVELEVRQLFELNYQARTLRVGGMFDVDAVRALVGGAYRDYTLPLLDLDVRDARAGILRQVSFKDVAVALDQWTAFGPSDSGAGRAEVTVSRTREEVRASGIPTAETATYQFRAERSRQGADGVRWQITDFVNPATGRWVSMPAPVATQAPFSEAQLAQELKSFFDKFYEARTLTSGHAIDLRLSEGFVAGSYDTYTVPLLEQSRAEAASGALKEVRYADISVRLEKWDPAFTDHGGLATVAVTRTSLVTRASGPEPPQTATLEFRVHGHIHVSACVSCPGPRAFVYWIVVDFVRPDVGRWLTDLDGATTIVPDVGHA